MRIRSLWQFGLSASVVVLALAGPARADECERDCRHDARECTRDTIPVTSDCRQECLSADNSGACIEACQEVKLAAMMTCRNSISACIENCDGTATAARKRGNSGQVGQAPSGPAAGGAVSCQGRCGIQLGQCAQEIATGGAGCLGECGTHGNRRGCMNNCTSEAQDIGQTCRQEAQACREACGGPVGTTTTTVPSTTTTMQGQTTTTMQGATTTTMGETTTTTMNETTSTTLGGGTTTTLDGATTTTLQGGTTTTMEGATTTTLGGGTTTTLTDVTSTTIGTMLRGGRGSRR